MATTLGGREQAFFSSAIYALSSLGLACAFHYLPYRNHNLIGLLIQFVPLAFLIRYTILLVRSATTRQRVAAAVLNVACAIAVVEYIGTGPFWPPPSEPPFMVIAGGAVMAISAFALAAIALVSQHRSSYLVGTVATLLIWPCLWLEFSTSREFGHYGIARLAGVLAVLGFAVAAATTQVRRVVGYWAGLLSSSLAWPYLVLRENLYPYRGNSWITFNLPLDPHEFGLLVTAALQILACVLTAVATIVSLMRLLPSSWVIRGIPIRTRTWPVFVLTFVSMATWFAFSVTPYRVPTEHGVAAEMNIVHFQRKGLHSKETRVAVMRDGKLYVCSEVRKPLRYTSDGECSWGTVPFERWQPILAFVRSPELKALGSSLKDVRAGWSSDTWYLYGDRMRGVAFTTRNSTTPPEEIVDWFNQMKAFPTGDPWHFSQRDICLGLCYEPQL